MTDNNTNPYVGLPRDMLEPDGQSIILLKLLKARGLNRDIKRRLADSAPSDLGEVSAQAVAQHLGSLPEQDRLLVCRWADPIRRVACFWAANIRGANGKVVFQTFDYMSSIDLLFLEEYDPEWTKLSFDEESFLISCPEWLKIRGWLERTMQNRTKRKLHFGVFMLWPRIAEELARWEDLEAARMRAVRHAIFALCSAGFTDWFAKRAVALCPALDGEFSFIESVEQSVTDEISHAEDSPVIDSWRDEWGRLLNRLDAVSLTLHENPTREAVAELLKIGEACSALSENLPKSQSQLRELILGEIAKLIERCRFWAEMPDFSWLDESAIDELNSAWLGALAAAGDEMEVLSQDVEVAIERTDSVGREYETGAARLRALQSEFDELSAGSRTNRPLAERRVAQHQRIEKELALVKLKGELAILQDDFLAAAGPFGEMPSASDEIVGFEGEPDASVPDGNDQESVSQEPELPVSVPVAESAPSEFIPTSSGEVDAGLIGSCVTDVEPHDSGAVAPETQQVDLQPRERTAESITPAVLEVAHADKKEEIAKQEQGAEAEDGLYSVAAGDLCRPIWKALTNGNLSLALQYAKALQQENADVKTPPIALLDSIVLANELVFPDGALREAVETGLEQISEGWFHEDAPPAWNEAINLLLVAATLRPMILAPGSAASTVAGYLHLDSEGRYRHLYALVQDLRRTSELLRGFRIELATIRSAKTQAAADKDIETLQRDASDWLNRQAPAVTIKFAAATSVWRTWLKPEGAIHRLISPVITNNESKVSSVKELIEELSDPAMFRKLTRKTDRVDNGRTKGEDIHSGALDHLGRSVQDGITLARRWVSAIESQKPSSDRMRQLLLEVRDFISRNLVAVRAELRCVAQDHWRLTTSAQSVCLRELDALQQLFDPTSELPATERDAPQARARDLLLVPGLSLSDGWKVVSSPVDIRDRTIAWLAEPCEAQVAFRSRLDSGDLLGADLMLRGILSSDGTTDFYDELRRAGEGWRAKLRSRLADVRRKIEIGSAYGYITDADRRGWEGRLVSLEADTPESGSFDLTFNEINSIEDVIRSNLDNKTALVHSSLDELKRQGKNPEHLGEVAKALEEGDVATANELLKRVKDGLPPWPEGTQLPDPFASFMPLVRGLEDWLSDRRSQDTVEQTIKKGEAVPGLDLAHVPGMQREQAAKLFEIWRIIKREKAADSSKLQTFFTGLGFALKQPPNREEKSQGREIWRLLSVPVEDRAICPVPHFGSAAKGNYRVMCFWEHPTGDDIVQLVGDSSLHRPTIVLYLGRISERKRVEIARKTKVAHKSFLLIDEVLLLFLAGQTGSRLAAAFSTALPFCYSDPYDATAGLVPPEVFFGRHVELQAVQGLNGRCFIYGGRQLGKTALMRRAEQSFHSPEANRFAAWIDLRAEGIGVSRDAQEVWGTIAGKLADIGVIEPSVAKRLPARKDGPESIVREVQNFLEARHDGRILLLLDEADRFFEHDGRNDFAETRRLKQLMDNTGRRFKVVFAGLHNVLRMTERANHPLAHFGEPIKIGPFIDEADIHEAQNLVRLPLAAAGFQFETPSLVIRILAQTNYYPSLIQLYCQHLLKHMLAKLRGPRDMAGPRYVITGQDIEAVYSSGDLRDEIRQKFRLTLQLDLRYEVIAYAMALAALGRNYPHDEGMDWRSIWQTGAMQWWPDGFRDTSELDFRVLLDEMVALGVLSRTDGGRYSLRNPNIFLLLGNQDEIEAVLVKDRQPTEEFDSAIYHPQVRVHDDGFERSPLTYQQLTELKRPQNTVFAIAGSRAADVESLVPSIRAHLEAVGGGHSEVILGSADHAAFRRRLMGIKDKLEDGLTLVLVSQSEPWSGLWVRDAQDVVGKMRSHSKFMSVVFIADPEMLWGCVGDDVLNQQDVPWMSLLPWRDSFLRQWLSDLKLPSTNANELGKVTGCWPRLLYSLVKDVTAAGLDRRIETETGRWSEHEFAEQRLQELGLGVSGPHRVLEALAEWGEPVQPEDLDEILEVDSGEASRALIWAERLGLARREGHDFWIIDPFVKRVLQASVR